MIFRLPEPLRSGRPHTRRGTIYVVTLATTMIVAALAIAALSTVRVQRRQATDANVARQAQLHAASSLQVARYRIRNDATWRAKLNSGTWASDQPIGTGYYSFTGTDPSDGNLLVGELDPVIITAIGKEGDCVQSLAARVEFEQPGLSCLQSAAHSVQDLEMTNVTVTSSGAPLSSNANVTPGVSSQVYANCEAVGTVAISGGAQVFGTTTNGVAARQMPDAPSTVNYYQTMGTSILATALPLWDRNYITNPGAETGAVSPWTTSSCSASTTPSEERSGSRSFHITNRTLLGDGYLQQDITAKVAQNVQYTVSGSVLDKNLLSLNGYRLHVLVQTSVGDTSFTSGWYSVNYDQWEDMTFTTTLSWTGDLLNAYVFVQSNDLLGLTPFYTDDVSIRETSAEANTYVVHRQLLSSQSNPFTGVLNSDGVYVLTCASNKINIRDARIAGTLVILNPGAGSRIEGSVCWEPPVVWSTNPSSPNMPALIANGALELGLNSASLSEALANMNFNPSGSPYAGSTDTDLTDSYPSQVTGVVYSSANLTVSKYSTINGSIVGGSGIVISGATPATSGVVLNQQPLYYYANPPIGFRASPVIKVKSGSIERVVQ